GLLEPTGGEVRLAGAPPAAARRQRAIGWLAQEDGLLPWRNVADNVALALRLEHGPGPRPLAWLRRWLGAGAEPKARLDPEPLPDPEFSQSVRRAARPEADVAADRVEDGMYHGPSDLRGLTDSRRPHGSTDGPSAPGVRSGSNDSWLPSGANDSL